VAAVAAAVGLLGLHLRRRPPTLGPLTVSPAVTSLSVRIGKPIAFSASAPHATAFTWSIWNRPVSHGATWSFRPAPDDAGWQQVVLVVEGAGDQHLRHTWDVGVVPAARPQVTDVSPPPRQVTGMPGEPVRFRCRARVPAARPADRLRFTWTLDGQPVQHDEHPASAGTSELVLPTVKAGAHRVAVRVAEDRRAASVVKWVLVVGDAGELPAVASSEEPLPGTRIAMVDGRQFAVGRAEIPPPASAGSLAAVVQLMSKNPRLLVYVDGYTDAVGGEVYNQRLSERRASAVRERLVQEGIAEARIVTRGFGETRPVASNASDEGRAQNRRVEVIVR